MSFIKINYELGSLPDLEARVAEGSVVIGRLYVYRGYNNKLCFVRNTRFPCDVVLNTAEQRGPALHNDVVAVELLPWEEWPSEPQKTILKDDGEEATATVTGGDVGPRAMPTTLPDGRHIIQLIAPETSKELAKNASAEVALSLQMDAPRVYEWPTGLRAAGRVLHILSRCLSRHHVARIAENQVQPGQMLRGDYYYRFRPINPLLPQLAVYGQAILPQYQADINNSLFSLALMEDEHGDVVKAPMTRDILLSSVFSFLGDSTSTEVAGNAICASCEVRNEPFSAEAEDCVLKDFVMPSPEELARMGRRDLRRTEFVCTIDPATARDLDDALSIRRRPDGGYHVGVHIADVSFFVSPGTALDEEAQMRSNSTYLVDRVIAMLPSRLSEQYCSLNPSEDKFAFSALFEFDRAGDLISEAVTGESPEWFGQSVIRSSCRLAYEQAQQILNDDDAVELDVSGAAAYFGLSEQQVRSKVKKSVKLLFELATKLRRKSFDDGRLVLGNTRLGFRFDKDRINAPPIGFYVQKQIEANWLVEEFMLFANQRVAQKVVQFIPNGALLRRHKAPSSHKMNLFRAALAQHGLPTGGSTGQELQRLMDTIKRDHADVYYTVCELLKYSLMAAEYLANDPAEKDVRSHFAVAAPWYTHFTSPIRRYCDLMVHRQLLVALELEQRMKAAQLEVPRIPDPSGQVKPGEEIFDATRTIAVDTLATKGLYYPQSQVELMVTHANQCRLNSRAAGDMSVEFFFCLYLTALKKRVREDPQMPQQICTSASIVKITDGSFFLFSSEIATEVEIGFKDTHQTFIFQGMVPQEGKSGSGAGKPETEEGKTINLKAKTHARKKGGKSTMTSSSDKGGRGEKMRPSSNVTTTFAACFSWGKPPHAAAASDIQQDGDISETTEVFRLFTEFVVELKTVVKQGRLCLEMIVLPPWEREAARLACPQVPTSIVEEA
ncbi:putative ribonuclease II-like protein [Leptomonas pyrrhocoris]|uniref:Putative ribonuclease II-like protein n=1 Tax=Leptomonas pyrrhocoris TaxID=157538 RepID=A0A0N0DZR4_LEPPY|nr:putative ribonuclease II-like protein [Leptomonas pyrrhocoris]KPA85522.1 putative ribonuclease II-like protein [Leptomonas pyrrhocoris]|eukprot:XP_015663961.1 putative ribonuclease II-like protein [Leptomonas pyrrhocoris]